LTRSVVLSPKEAARVLRKEIASVPSGSARGKRKKPGSGATAMKHARAVCDRRWRGVPRLEAAKTIVWIPDKRGPCGACGRNLQPMSRKEDLFGCFDLMILTGLLLLIQVTTELRDDADGGWTVTARKKKIEELYIERFFASGAALVTEYPRIEIWSWVARKHFRLFSWRWDNRSWRELSPLPSPLLKRGR